MEGNDVLDIIKLVWPIILLQFFFQIYAIVDIIRRQKTRNLSMAAWVIIVIFGEILGAVAYFLVGRAESE